MKQIFKTPSLFAAFTNIIEEECLTEDCSGESQDLDELNDEPVDPSTVPGRRFARRRSFKPNYQNN